MLESGARLMSKAGSVMFRGGEWENQNSSHGLHLKIFKLSPQHQQKKKIRKLLFKLKQSKDVLDSAKRSSASKAGSRNDRLG